MEAEHMMLKMEHEGCKGEIEKYKNDIQQLEGSIEAMNPKSKNKKKKKWENGGDLSIIKFMQILSNF